MIARRNLIASALAATGVPAVAQPVAPGRIGYLHPRTADDDSPTVRILRPEWQRLGYVTGQSVLLRSADGDLARLPSLAAELVSLGAGVLIVVGPSALRAAAAAVPGTPLVAIDLETDPVRSGLAASYSRPGGAVTGLFLDQPSLVGKWIELLREAVPGLERLAVVWDPSTTRDQLDAAREVAARIALPAVIVEANRVGEFEPAFARLSGAPRTGLIHLGSPGFSVVAPDFVAAAQRHRLPSISYLRVYAEAGLMMTYGPNQAQFYSRAVALADRILRGRPAGEIPVERPDSFEFVINLRTAKALGLALPPAMLALADEVIE